MCMQIDLVFGSLFQRKCVIGESSRALDDTDVKSPGPIIYGSLKERLACSLTDRQENMSFFTYLLSIFLEVLRNGIVDVPSF